jgi:hypothetical protein
MLHAVSVLPRSWRRPAMLLVLLAANVAIVGTLDSPADARTAGRLACYLALADDLGSIMESDLRHTTVASAECEEARASAKAAAHFDVHRSTTTGANPVGTD